MPYEIKVIPQEKKKKERKHTHKHKRITQKIVSFRESNSQTWLEILLIKSPS